MRRHITTIALILAALAAATHGGIKMSKLIRRLFRRPSHCNCQAQILKLQAQVEEIHRVIGPAGWAA